MVVPSALLSVYAMISSSVPSLKPTVTLESGRSMMRPRSDDVLPRPSSTIASLIDVFTVSIRANTPFTLRLPSMLTSFCMYVFPMTVKTLLPVSSTNRLEPTSNVCTGLLFAIPTFDSVTNAVSGLLNSRVYVVVLPNPDTN